MLAIWTVNLEQGRHREYKKWVVRNISKLRQYYEPLGWHIKGVYTSPAYLSRYDVTWIWEFEKYADLDTIEEANDPEIERLQDEENQFYVAGTAHTEILAEVEIGSGTTRPKRNRARQRT